MIENSSVISIPLDPDTPIGQQQHKDKHDDGHKHDPTEDSLRLPKRWRPIFPLMVYGMFSAAAFIMISTHIPLQYKKFFGSDAKASVMQSTFNAVGGLISFFTTGVFGFVSDVKGRRPIIVLSAFVSVLPMALNSAFGGDNMWPFLIFSTVWPGLFGGSLIGNMPLINAMIADMYPKAERGIPMVMVMTSFFLGLVGGVLPNVLKWNADTTNYVAAVVSLCNFIFVCIFIKESLPASKRMVSGAITPQPNTQIVFHDDESEEPTVENAATLNRARAASVSSAVASGGVVLRADANESLLTLILHQLSKPLEPLKYVWVSPLLRYIAFITFCIIAPAIGAENLGVYYFNKKLGIGSKEIGRFLAVVGITYILLTLIAIPLMVKKLTSLQSIMIGFIVLIAHELLAAFAWNTTALYAFVAPTAGLPFLVFPLLADVASVSVGPQEQGLVQGTIGAFRGLANALAPIVASQFFALGVNIGFMQLPWLIFAVVALIGLLLTRYGLLPELLKRSGSAGAEATKLLRQSDLE